MMISNPQMESIGRCIISSRKLQLGVMVVCGYAYADSKEVVFGPIRDMTHISHGPIGYGRYLRAGQRNYYIGASSVDSFGTLNLTSDFQERDIVFGSDKELTKLVEEMEQLFLLTKRITIQSECPVSLIGDDINAVANASSKVLDKLVISMCCEGFCGVLQSLGHHVVNDVVRDWVLNNREGQPFASTPYDIAIVGDYSIGGDAWASRVLLKEMGLHLVAQWSDSGTLAEMESTSFVKLNLVHCYRPANYIARRMEEKHQIPWMEYNFLGPTKIAESLRKIADQSDDTVRTNVEAMIAKYEGQVVAIVAKYHPRLRGRKVLLYTGGLQLCHIIGAYGDLGMEIIAAGCEFTRNDDYNRTLPDLREGTLLLGDASSYKLKAFVKVLRPDLIDSGTGEKHILQKTEVPFRQMYSQDYPGPCRDYDGFVISARGMDVTLNNPAWNEPIVP